MSEDNTNPRANIAAQIDAMVTAAGAGVERSQRLASVDGTRAHSVKVDHDGSVRFEGTAHEAERTPDSGIDLDRSRVVNAERVSKLQAQLDEVRFDPRTGAPAHVVQGQARELLQMQATTARNAAIFDDQRFALIEAQRARDAQWRAAEAEERLTYLRVTGGDPAKMERLQELLGDEGLKTAAKAILAARYEKAR